MAVAVLDLERAARVARETALDPEAVALLDEMNARRHTKAAEMARFATLCDRWDNLYYPNDVESSPGGADHWPEGIRSGRAHISLNVYPVYVDIPAALQAIPPIENLVSPKQDDKVMDSLAAAAERVYFSWKEDEEFELKGHQACIVKGLYGHTAAKVWWDDENERPTFSIVEQPRNLWLGWSGTDYRRLDWAMYTYRIGPEAAHEEFGLVISGTRDPRTGSLLPIVMQNTSDGFISTPARSWLQDEYLMAEVYDYWYRRPVEGATTRLGKPVEYETWNAIFVGNVMVKNEAHPEYKGRMPYVPLFNSYIPGVPDGRPDLYDVEQLIREKDERMSAGAQMISKGVSGQFWQLTGPDAPWTVPAGVKPTEDEVVGTGPGNRIEPISPWMPEFQLEQFLTRLDRDMVDVTGLNDMLRGLAPAAVLSSSKAIAALTANYELRMFMRRSLYYRWRKDVWKLAQQVWGEKESDVKSVFSMPFRLSVKSPSLTPRDDMEQATLAANLVSSKLWSQARGMDHVDVEDPEQEQGLIRMERTDATLFPADVQVMAQLLALLRNLGIQPQPAAAAMAGGQAAALAGVRALSGGQTGMPSLNGPGEQPMGPPEAAPSNTPQGEALAGPPGPAGPAAPAPAGAGGPGGALLQTQIKEGEPSNRILTQQQVG